MSTVLLMRMMGLLSGVTVRTPSIAHGPEPKPGMVVIHVDGVGNVDA